MEKVLVTGATGQIGSVLVHLASLLSVMAEGKPQLALGYNTCMNTSEYLSEVEKRLSKMFTASKEGYKAAPIERHRLEGFMQAGVFLGLVTNAELLELMEAVHLNVYGQTIAERRAACSTSWKNEAMDYSQYDQPAYIRKNN